MDCDDYLNMDTGKLREFCRLECDFNEGKLINKKSGARIKAIIPVHVFGNPADMEKIMDVAQEFGLKVIEDAAESIGSFYQTGKYKGKKTGSIGHIGCLSFNGNKIITTGGGGMVVTNIPEYAERARYLTTQSKDDPRFYVHNEIGYNYRMTNLQAALGCAQLEQLDGFIKLKRKNYAIYRKHIDRIDGLGLVHEPGYGLSNRWFYSLLIDRKVHGLSLIELMEKLAANKIEARPLWHLNHMQKPHKDCRAYKIEKAGILSERILNIPSSVTLSEDEICYVCKILKKILEERKELTRS